MWRWGTVKLELNGQYSVWSCTCIIHWFDYYYFVLKKGFHLLKTVALKILKSKIYQNMLMSSCARAAPSRRDPDKVEAKEEKKPNITAHFPSLYFRTLKK